MSRIALIALATALALVGYTQSSDENAWLWSVGCLTCWVALHYLDAKETHR